MRSRLEAALDAGELVVPEARSVLAAGIGAGHDLSPLAPSRLQVVQPFRPDYEDLTALGVAVTPSFADAGAGHDMGFIALPRARERAQAWIAQTAARLAPGGMLLLDGAKTDGIDAMHRALRDRMGGYGTLAKAHGRLLWGQPTVDGFSDWLPVPRSVESYATRAGVFSAAHVDPGSRLLADALPAGLSGVIVDLGAGWGYLAARLLNSEAPARVHLVEADFDALAAARANIDDGRAVFHWADARSWRPDGFADAVVSNPPFHAGRAADPDLGREFIRSAAAMMSSRGSLWIVANRQLPYEVDLDSAFGEWHEVAGTRAFKVIRASRPRNVRRGQSR